MSTSTFRSIHLFVPVTLFFALIACGDCASGQEPKGKAFLVSPVGSDRHPGTTSQPLATFAAARDAARNAQPENKRIVVMPGEYYLTEPFDLDSRDNGLTIEADPSGPVKVFGGTKVTGWQRDGDKLWSVDIPGVQEGTSDFRALVVDGRMPERARLPETGKFTHLQTFEVAALPSIAGTFARKPTREELTTMRYDPKDVPATLDVRNAEVRVYHMWDESLVGVARNDIQRHELIFSGPTSYPVGSFGKKDYVIWNTREGMTKPGRWYLDRTAGRLVYWPLEGEDMSKVNVIVPKLERIIRINGSKDKQVENLTIRGLALQATTTPLRPAGMGAISFGGALTMTHTAHCNIEKLEISNVGGVGVSATDTTHCRIIDCHVHDIGACGVRVDGTDLFFARNHVHDVGSHYPSAAGISSREGARNHFYRNEIHDVPYIGMLVGKTDVLVEENLVYRVMREIQDGSAIYASLANRCILRGNVARDITPVGTGFGVSAYYFDEGSHDCVIENNISMAVARPILSHIARDSVIRDNVFITESDMTLSFQSSANITFERNTLIAPGKIGIVSPNAVIKWQGNRIFRDGRDKNNVSQAFTIDAAMPPFAVPAKKARPIEVARAVRAPNLDGELSADEWPGAYQNLDRELSRLPYSGAPVIVKFARDDAYLYVGAMMAMFDDANISRGNQWGKNDGVEISIGGFDHGKPVTFVIRGYVDGSLQSVTVAGASDAAAQRLGKEVKFVTKMRQKTWLGGGWIGEWAIPLDAIGLKPEPDTKVPFNMCAFLNEYGKWHCWEGTLGESWQVDKAGSLLFK